MGRVITTFERADMVDANSKSGAKAGTGDGALELHEVRSQASGCCLSLSPSLPLSLSPSLFPSLSLVPLSPSPSLSLVPCP